MLPCELAYFGQVNLGVVRNEGDDLTAFKQRMWTSFIKLEYGMSARELEAQTGIDSPVIAKERKRGTVDMRTPEERQYEDMLSQNPAAADTLAYVLWIALCNVTRDVAEWPQGAPWPQIVKRCVALARSSQKVQNRMSVREDIAARERWKNTKKVLDRHINEAIDKNLLKYRIVSAPHPKKGSARLYRLEPIV